MRTNLRPGVAAMVFAWRAALRAAAGVRRLAFMESEVFTTCSRTAVETPSRRKSFAVALLGAWIGAAFLGFADSASALEPFSTGGAGQKSRVVIVEDDAATAAFEPREAVVRAMVEKGLLKLTGQPTVREAWLGLVTTQDVVGIKVDAAPGPHIGTRPAVAEAVARSLIEAGLPATNIVIWDRSEIDLRLSGFFAVGRMLGVRVAASGRAGYDPEVFYDTPLIGTLVWGDMEFEKQGENVGRKSFVSKLLTHDITRIVNLTPLLNSNVTGVSGNLVGLSLGSVDNIHRFEGDPKRLARAVPEIYALPSLSDRVALSITDALICQYEGGQQAMLHYSAVLNELRFSRDPVALDVLSIKELEQRRRLAQAAAVKPNMDIYQNAALLELGVCELEKMEILRVK